MNGLQRAYDVVRQFEKEIAEFAGSKYAVAVDSGTAALFLCCRYLSVGKVKIPKHTYCSVPGAIIHAGGTVEFEDREWEGEYELFPYRVIDSACCFRRGMHKPYTFRCLSFQYRKHLPIGRGGMILHDNPDADDWFRKARFHGRPETPMNDDTPAFVGWHLFMEPERAARGLHLFHSLRGDLPDLHFDYPDLSKAEVYS